MEASRLRRQAVKSPVIHLDTNFLIDALLPGSTQEGQIVGWLNAGVSLPTGNGCALI